MRKRYRRPRRSSRDEHWPSWPGGINTADPATLPVRLLRNRILRPVRRARRVASFSPENKHLSTENNRLCRHNDAAAPKDGHLAKADVASVPQTKRSSPKTPSRARARLKIVGGGLAPAYGLILPGIELKWAELQPWLRPAAACTNTDPAHTSVTPF